MGLGRGWESAEMISQNALLQGGIEQLSTVAAQGVGNAAISPVCLSMCYNQRLWGCSTRRGDHMIQVSPHYSSHGGQVSSVLQEQWNVQYVWFNSIAA